MKNKINIDHSIFEPILMPLYLTQSTMAYDILEFKFNKETSRYEAKSLYSEGIRQILIKAGFYKKYISPIKSVLIHKSGNFIRTVSAENIKDAFQKFVLAKKQYEFHYGKSSGDQEESENEQGLVKYSIPEETIKNIFLKQSHNFFNEKWLEHLPVEDSPILKDTKKKSVFVFNNCFVTVSKSDGIEAQDLNKLDGFVLWKNQQIQKDFKLVNNPKDNPFAHFLTNVTSGIENRLEAMQTAIGFLIHNYSDPAKSIAVLFYDQEITDPTRPQGGTGKGVVANAIKQLRNVAKIDGKLLSLNNRFKFELVTPETQLVWIDDPRKDFEFEILFSCLSDGWTIERKYMPQFFIEPENSPKVLIASNVILNRRGTSNQRRQFIVELNDYYSSRIIPGKTSPIEEEHGILFGETWTDTEWNTFFSYMLNCVHLYHKEGLISYKTENVEANFLLQQTNEDFVEYVESLNLKPNEWYDTTVLFVEFVKTYYGPDSKFKQRGFTNWLKEYARSVNMTFEPKSSGGKTSFRLIPPKQETT
jgi:hypothetical protein